MTPIQTEMFSELNPLGNRNKVRYNTKSNSKKFVMNHNRLEFSKRLNEYAEVRRSSENLLDKKSYETPGLVKIKDQR